MGLQGEVTMESIFSHQDQKQICRLSGELTYHDNESYKKVTQAIAASTGRTFILDLSGIEYVDSFGIGLIVMARDEAAKHQVNLSMNGARPSLLSMFDRMKLSDTLPLDGVPHVPHDNGNYKPETQHLDVQVQPNAARLSGRFCMSDQARFLPVIDAITQLKNANFRIDLSGLSFMDSTGLSLVFAANDAARRNQVTLILDNPTPNVKKMFHLVAVDQVLQVNG